MDHSHRTLFDHPVCLLPPGPPADEGDDDGSGRQDLGDDAGNELGGVRRGAVRECGSTTPTGQDSPR
jgi:hypothetical protein